MSAPTRASTAGRAYLDLRKLARENHRPVDELLQLYVLEAFLDRLTSSPFTEQLVLKGGVLLAAFDERRPTRDIDLQAQALENDTETILTATREIAAITLDDGVIFDIETRASHALKNERYPIVLSIPDEDGREHDKADERRHIGRGMREAQRRRLDAGVEHADDANGRQ